MGYLKQLGVILFCAASFSLAHNAHAAILINELLADPPTVSGDANRDGVSSAMQDEFVELVNTGSTPVSLASWTLSDLLTIRHAFSPDARIPAEGFYVVFGGGVPQGFSHAATASSGTLSLNNTGDTVTLRDAHGALIDTLVYGVEGGKDASLTRVPDGSGPLANHMITTGRAFSPGTTIDGAPLLPHAAEPPSLPEPSSRTFLLIGFLMLLTGNFVFRQGRRNSSSALS